ncbi:MAG: arginine deiminase family protein [archaeon]
MSESDRSTDRIGVYSDSSILKKVVLHRPGEELLFNPDKSDDFLFDGPPIIPKILEEYDEFVRLIEVFGSEIFFFEDMLIHVLDNNKDLREQLLEDLVKDEWMKLDGKESDFLINKINTKDFVGFIISGYYPASRKGPKMDPTTNLMFTRDPMAVVGNNLLWTWHRPKRNRRKESFLVDLVIRYHPAFSDLKDIGSSTMNDPSIMIEGGDIMVANENLLMIGFCRNQRQTRTTYNGIKHLAKHIIPDGFSILLVEFTRHHTKNTIHMDTIGTFASDDYFFADRRIFEQPTGTQSGVGLFLIDKDNLGELIEPSSKENDWPPGRISDRNFFEVIEPFGLKPEPIYTDDCEGKFGGLIPMREQWMLAMNNFALGPNKVIAYEYSIFTLKVAKEEGFTILPSTEIKERQDFYNHRKLIVTIPATELLRTRGGPHCLSMPLERE